MKRNKLTFYDAKTTGIMIGKCKDVLRISAIRSSIGSATRHLVITLHDNTFKKSSPQFVYGGGSIVLVLRVFNSVRMHHKCSQLQYQS